MSQTSQLEAQIRPLITWLGRHVNAHRFLWLMAVVAFLIAWNRGVALLYGLFALILALQAVSWVLPWWMLRKMHVHRHQVGMAHAGRSCTLQYHFISTHPAYYISVAESFKGMREPQAHFIPTTQPEDFPGYFRFNYHCPQRGVYKLPALELRSAWPFGFLERKVSVAAATLEVRVVPKVFRIANLPLPSLDNPVMEGADSFMSRGAHSEFAGLRDHRQGDSLKHIHWAASARMQHLVVREFHSYDTPSWLVVIDGERGASVGQGADTTFEYALQIGASMLDYARRHNQSMTLIISAARPVRLDIHPGQQDINAHLEVLAGVIDDGQLSYDDAIQEALSGEINPPILVTVRRQSQVINANHSGGHLDIVYADASFDLPMGGYAEGWDNKMGQRLQLNLHRLSRLPQVFGS